MGKRGNSIIEVIVVIVILTSGIVGTFSILNSSQILSTTTENKIKAINIAREGIEAVTNIRDTNWIKFSSDYTNCWLVKDYKNVECIGSPDYYFNSGSYILNQSGSLWYLTGYIISDSVPSFGTGYINKFPIYFDSNGFISQIQNTSVKCSSSTNTGCLSIFTREIRLNITNSKEVKVNSIVKWQDSAKKDGPHVINLETILTNWKSNF